MNIPSSLTIITGALAPDGGSVFLEALDDQSHRRTIMLDWSLAAQEFSATTLDVDGITVAKRTVEEAAWIEIIASATIAAQNHAAISPARKDAVTAGLVALRDNLVEKVRSSTHQPKKA